MRLNFIHVTFSQKHLRKLKTIGFTHSKGLAKTNETELSTWEHVTVKQNFLCKFYLFVDKGYSDHKKNNFLVHDREPMPLFMLTIQLLGYQTTIL